MKTYDLSPTWVAPIVSLVITGLLIYIAFVFLSLPAALLGVLFFVCWMVVGSLLFRILEGRRAARYRREYYSTEITPPVVVTTTDKTTTLTTKTHIYQDGITRNDFGIPLGENTTQTTHHSFPQPLSFYTGTPPFCSEGLGEDFS